MYPNAAGLAGKHINFTGFSFTRQGLEHTIHNTHSEYAEYYTTNTVPINNDDVLEMHTTNEIDVLFFV